MSQAMLRGRAIMTANEAAAYAVMLARAQVIGSYPITPQTVIVERLSELVAGRDDVEYVNVDSEHSAFGYVIAASRLGVRTFTATSSQGLLYAHEQLHRAARERAPVVAVNVNRSLFSPWSLEPDLSDSMSQRDTGWIQLYCSSAQEVLDTVLCAYRIAESVLLPVLVCEEGFILSHTAEAVDVPDQETVDAFIPEFHPPEEWVVDPEIPTAFSTMPQPRDYATLQRRVADAMEEAKGVIESVTAEFTSHFGREKVGAIEVSGNPDADTALITIGTIGDSAKELLEDGEEDLLAVRVHAFRPFPREQLEPVLSGVAKICVVDRMCPFGSFGPLGTDVRALRLEGAAVTNVSCGVGGVEVTPDTLRWSLNEARSRSARAASAGPVFVPEGV